MLRNCIALPYHYIKKSTHNTPDMGLDGSVHLQQHFSAGSASGIIWKKY
jgi:hypothetical protein